MKIFIHIFVLFIFMGNLHANEVIEIDRLLQQLKNKKTDTAQVNLLNKISEKYLYIDTEKINEFARQALKLSEDINYQKGIAQSFNNLGIYYRAKGIYSQSIDYTFRSLEIMEALNDQGGIARCYNLIGIIYFFLENYKLSLEYYIKALDINKQQNDLKWIAGNSNNIGMIHERQGNYEQALQFYLTSLEMNIQLGNKNWIANNYGNIGSLYLKMGNPLSLDYLKRRLAITRNQKNRDGISLSNLYIGNYYFSNELYKEAISYYIESYTIAKEIGVLNKLSKSSKKLSASYAAIGDFKKAYVYHNLFKQYDDSLNLHANTQKITRLQMHEKHMINKQVEYMKHERSKFINSMIAIILIFLILFTFILYNRQKSIAKQHRLEQKKLALKNKALAEEIEFKENLLQENIKYLVDKNELLSTVIESFNKIKQTCKNKNQRIINEVIFELQTGVEDNIWEEFELRFNQIHSNFYKNLKQNFPQLSASDKKLCAFLRLNMTTKEISAITHQSVKSIETARSRLRKKLNIVNSELSLNQFLSKY
ncbi:MAG: tetratricopeptide repeat protein [Bacteroidales bacterium]|nr:tetratricopeptide repeat protein [Bacteroidales bacterium]